MRPTPQRQPMRECRSSAACTDWRLSFGQHRMPGSTEADALVQDHVHRSRAKPPKSEPEGERLDNAARAGWLYYVAGNTQDEVAQKLGVSRQTAQRLVAMAVSERLIKVRLDHPIARCMELAARLTDRFGLTLCVVVPSDPAPASSSVGIAEAAAADMEQRLKS